MAPLRSDASSTKRARSGSAPPPGTNSSLPPPRPSQPPAAERTSDRGTATLTRADPTTPAEPTDQTVEGQQRHAAPPAASACAPPPAGSPPGTRDARGT